MSFKNKSNVCMLGISLCVKLINANSKKCKSKLNNVVLTCTNAAKKKQFCYWERACHGLCEIYFAGASLGITSDGFFELEELPRRSVVVGAGYIAVEIAGILSTLGSKTSLLIRHDKVLRTFDSMISANCTQELENAGIDVWKHSLVKSVTKSSLGLLEVTVISSAPGHKPTVSTIPDVDCLLWAIGRNPNTEGLNLDKLGLKLDATGHIVVDEFQNTSRKGIYAVGDVCGKALLTPGNRPVLHSAVLPPRGSHTCD
uniref:Glutathione-disulfide reductase n=1 Tax=Terrapene triunguis TaxID=2587831 RepID=A0A674IMT7_9SAUR